MGLLFQPRRPVTGAPPAGTARHPDVPTVDRRLVLLAALEAVVLGDGSGFEDFFTDDVAFSSPHVALVSRRAVHETVGVPEDSLSEVDVVLTSLDAIGEKLLAEWRLTALFTRPIVFDDSVLIEPTGTRVELSGASVAEFRGRRICAFRHYFDDSELVDDVPGVPGHLRWMPAGRTAPRRR